MRAAKTTPSRRELEARRLAPWTPGAGGFADGEQAGEAGAAVEVGEDAAHQVVGGR